MILQQTFHLVLDFHFLDRRYKQFYSRRLGDEGKRKGSGCGCAVSPAGGGGGTGTNGADVFHLKSQNKMLGKGEATAGFLD